jgi:hypothetical protein
MEAEILKQRRRSGLILFNFPNKQMAFRDGGLIKRGSDSIVSESEHRKQPIIRKNQSKQPRWGEVLEVE